MSIFKRVMFFVAAAAVAGCMMHVDRFTSSSSSWNDNDLKVRRAIDVTADRDITALEFTVPYSSVSVTSNPSIHRIHVTGYVKELTENESTIEWTSTGPNLVSHSTPPARFDGVKIEVPAGTTLNILTSSGAVSAANLAATAHVQLKSSYGNIELRDCGAIPMIRLETSSGAVTVSTVQSFHDLNVHSSYGNLDIAHATGDAEASVDANTSSGAIRMTDVHNARIDAKSSYGNVALDESSNVAASLVSSSGAIKAASLDHAGDLSLHSSYGNADLSNIPQAGTIHVHCDSGTVSVSGTSSPSADFSTSYGNITLRDCQFASLATQCNSGRMSQENVRVGK